jgi:hypothetical protein
LECVRDDRDYHRGSKARNRRDCDGVVSHGSLRLSYPCLIAYFMPHSPLETTPGIWWGCIPAAVKVRVGSPQWHPPRSPQVCLGRAYRLPFPRSFPRDYPRPRQRNYLAGQVSVLDRTQPCRPSSPVVVEATSGYETGVKLECAKTHGLVPFTGLVAKFGIEHTPIDLLHPFPADEMEAF